MTIQQAKPTITVIVCLVAGVMCAGLTTDRRPINTGPFSECFQRYAPDTTKDRELLGICLGALEPLS